MIKDVFFSTDIPNHVRSSFLYEYNFLDHDLVGVVLNKNNLYNLQINNVSKMAGPIGSPGSAGPSGPKGSGSFSSCQYKVVAETLTAGDSATIAGLNEPNVSMLDGKQKFNVNSKYSFTCHKKRFLKFRKREKMMKDHKNDA